MLTHETNHLQRLLELLPLQYGGLARWEAIMVRCWAPEIQRLEDGADDLLEQLQLATATGAWLDLWGRLLQLPNTAGEDDATYRRLLTARAKAIAANGSAATLVDIATAVLPDGDAALLIETPPTSAQLQLTSDLGPGLRAMTAEVLYSGVPLGVRLLIVQCPTGDDEGFDVTQLDTETSYRARVAGAWEIPEQRWFADELADGDLRLDMFGDLI